MPYEGEYAGYRALRRVAETERVQAAPSSGEGRPDARDAPTPHSSDHRGLCGATPALRRRDRRQLQRG